jgi:hypothetical protein
VTEKFMIHVFHHALQVKRKFACQITPQNKAAINSYLIAYTTSKKSAHSLVTINNWPYIDTAYFLQNDS